MKIAICLSGQMRTLDRCADSVRQHILSRYDCDVFVHAADDPDAWMAGLLEPLRAAKVGQPEFDEKNYIHRSGRGVVAPQGVLRMLWSIQEADAMRRAAEEERGQRYDWVVRLRGDTQFFTDIEDLATLDPSAVYIPTYCNYWGCNDRFGFGGSEAMTVYSQKFGLLDEYVAGGGIFHPESFLKWALARGGVPIRRTEMLFDTIRKNGDRDRPIWRAECGDAVPDWKMPFLVR